jgi:hypothetical protein
MNTRTFTRFVLLVLLGLGYTITGSNAQDLSPWTDNPYGNEWIDYSKKYVRVGVTANGLYKVPFGALSTSLKKGSEAITPAQIQLWHRGKEVSIISADNDWVVFYGEKNDGASDGLMFRPGPEARLNPHVSFYSEEGSYFFTVAVNPKRMTTVSVNPNGVTDEPQLYHFQTDIKKYDTYQLNSYPITGTGLTDKRITRENKTGSIANQQFSGTTLNVGNHLNQSYFETANGWVGPTIYGPKTGLLAQGTWYSLAPKSLDLPVKLINWNKQALSKPVIEMAVHGLHDGTHKISAYMSSSAADVNSKKILTFPTFNGFQGEKSAIELDNPTANLTDQGDGVIRIKSSTSEESSSINVEDYNWFSIGYYSITYPQTTDLGVGANSVKSVVYNYKPTNSISSMIGISNATASTRIFDISNKNSIAELVGGSFSGTVLQLNVPRINNQNLQLLVIDGNSANGIVELVPSVIKSVNHGPLYEKTDAAGGGYVDGAINPQSYDYLIITNDGSDSDIGRDLRPSAIKYASEYRATAAGGNYRTLVMDTRSIYDQFNYGEPSPLAISRFVNYMIKNEVRDKHNLLLIGYSVSYPLRVVKELPGEVPTYGDPGSDVLLVCGLSNGPLSPDVPAIPVGRISAFRSFEVDNYLSKVKEYERQTAKESAVNLSWRKNIVHVVGAKFKYELPIFKGIFNKVSTHVNELENTRSIVTLSNDAHATSDITEAPRMPAPLAPEVNNGVGMITYYGHGNQEGTKYDFRRISLPDFSENDKYSFVYFNGCGIGHIFSSHLTQMPSTNWLITPRKGAIAIFANSDKSYVPPTEKYIEELYKQLFSVNDRQRQTVGKILRNLASLTVTNNAYQRVMADIFQVTNIHQTNLYGDPALRVLGTTPDGSLPVDLNGFNAFLDNANQVRLEWKTAWEKNNSHFVIERSYNSRFFESIGEVEGKGNIDVVTNYRFLDTKPFSGTNYYRLKQIDAGEDNLKSSYSKVVSVSIPNSESVYAYPNPSTDEVSIRLNIPTKVKTWKLYDSNGRLSISGDNEKFSLQDAVSGTYILEIVTSDGDVFRETIVKK